MAKINIDVNDVVSSAGKPTRPGSVTDSGIGSAPQQAPSSAPSTSARAEEKAQEPSRPERREQAVDQRDQSRTEEPAARAEREVERVEPVRAERTEKPEGKSFQSSGYEAADELSDPQPQQVPVISDDKRAPSPSDEVEPIEVEGSEVGSNELVPDTEEPPVIEVSESAARIAERDSRRAVVPDAVDPGSAPPSQQVSRAMFSADDVPPIEDMGTMVSDQRPADPVMSKRRPLKRFAEMAKSVKDSASAALGRRGRIGNAVGGMGAVDPDLDIDQISMGTEELMLACEQATSKIPRFISGITGIPENAIIDAAMTRNRSELDKIINAVNAVDVEVYVEKQPVTGASDQMALRLRLHHGPAFRLHPLVAKAFNADFDGDTYKVIVDRDALVGLPRPMDRIITVGGNPTVDEKFFLLKQREFNPEDNLAYMRKMVDFVFSDGRIRESTRSDIADDLNDYLFAKEKKDESAAWELLFRDIKKAAREIDASRVNRISADLLKDLYDHNNFEYRFDSAKTAISDLELSGYSYEAPESSMVESTTDTAKIVDWMQGVYSDVERWLKDPSVHRIPLNYQDFSNMFGMSTEYHEGQNIQFRIAASFGKMIKLDESMLVGSEFVFGSESLADLYNCCADFMMTKIMSSRITSGEKQFILSSIIREKIIVSKTGRLLIPSDFKFRDGKIDWRTFLNGSQDGTQDGFLSRYEYFGGIADEADIKIGTDFLVRRGPQKYRGSLSDRRSTSSPESIARWMLRTYGDYTMGRLFLGKFDPNTRTYSMAGDSEVNAMLEPYAGMTLREWCSRQDGSIGTIGKNAGSGNIRTLDILVAIADLRRRKSVEYQDAMGKAMENAYDRIVELRDVLDEYESGSLDHLAFIDSTTELLAMLHPDMFAHYGMDNPQNWINSVWGSELLSASSPDALQAIFAKMVVDFRLSRARRYASEFREIVSSEALVKPSAEGKRAQHEMEMWAIKKSSPLWRMIAQDVQDRGSQLSMIAEKISDSMSRNVRSGNGKLLVDGMIMDTDEKKLSEVIGEYSSVMQIIKSDMGWNEKQDILCDLLKVFSGRRYTSREMYWMLDQDPTSQYSGSIFADNDGYSKTMEQMKKASRRLGEETRKEFDRSVDDVRRARLKFGGKPGALENHLSSIAENLGNLVEVDKFTYVDALNSVMDKYFSASEKSKQQESVNAIHSALSLMRSGGLFSDLAVTDDFLSGRIAKDRLLSNPTVFAVVLANPSIELTVYDETGSFVMSRESLCGGVDEELVWDFLEEHPRIAQAIRRHRAIPGDGGRCYLAAKGSLVNSIKESMEVTKSSVIGNARSALMDHPGLGCIVMAGVELSGRTSRHSRGSLAKKVDDVVENLIKLSRMDGREISDFCDNLHFDGPPEGKDAEEWSLKCDKLRNYIKSYALELKGMGTIDRGHHVPSGTPRFSMRLEDPATYSAIDDIEQELAGGKTENMTGVNGAETRRNGLFSFYAASKPEPCGAPPVDIPAEEILADKERYLGWKTEQGVYITTEYLDTITAGGVVRAYDPATCQCGLHCCKNHSVADGSSDYRSSTQLTAMSLMMIIQRTDSTEKNNLKAKKSGWDGMDSITKFSVFDMLSGIGKIKSDYARASGIVREKFEAGGIEAARREYAKLLKANQEALGYDDLTISQYENIAHMLLVPRGDGVEIMSASQIAYLVNYGVRPEEVFGLTDTRDLVGIFDKMVADYGSIREFDVEEMLASVKVSGISNVRGVVRERSSSLERTFSQIERLGIGVQSREVIIGEYGKWTSSFGDIVKEFPYAAKRTKEVDKLGEEIWKFGRYDRRSKYDLLGVICKRNQNLNTLCESAGPASLWLVDPDGVEVGVLQDMLDKAKRSGTNVAFPAGPNNWIPADMRENIIEMPNNTRMIPFFDMLLNGADEVEPTSGFDIGLACIPEDRVTRMAESTQNEFRAGDSDGIATEHLVKRSGASKSGKYPVLLSKLFGPTFEEFYGTVEPFKFNDRGRSRHQPPSASIATKAEEEWLSKMSDEELLTIVDIGVDRNDKRYEQAVADFKFAMRQWRLTAQSRESSPGKRVRPGHIVGFAKLDVPESGATVWAPIRPFRLDEGKGSPREFDVESVSINPNTGQIFVSWDHRRSLLGSVFKFFEGRNPANKMIIRDVVAKGERKLRSGNHIDIYVGENSTKTRRMSNLRLDTMYTLVIEARCNPHGYNFAEHEDSFPGREDIKNAVLTGSASFSDWKGWIDEGVTFLDPSLSERHGKLNAWLNEQCRHALALGVNPSFWIASRFDEGGSKIPHNMVFRYDAMFTNNPSYQESLQSFLNFMDERICPPTIGGDYSKCLFRNDPSDGSLLMLVPYLDPGGKQYEVWEHVYTSYSFMDQHYSGFVKPQISGAQNSPSAVLTAGYNGRIPRGTSFEGVARWSMSDRAQAVAGPSSMYLE